MRCWSSASSLGGVVCQPPMRPPFRSCMRYIMPIKESGWIVYSGFIGHWSGTIVSMCWRCLDCNELGIPDAGR